MFSCSSLQNYQMLVLHIKDSSKVKHMKCAKVVLYDGAQEHSMYTALCSKQILYPSTLITKNGPSEMLTWVTFPFDRETTAKSTLMIERNF